MRQWNYVRAWQTLKPLKYCRSIVSMSNETAVHFTLLAPERLHLRVTDVLGREVLRTATQAYGVGNQAIRLVAR